MHIVAVDDSEMILEYICEVLEGAGHTVYLATDGHAAIDVVSANPIDLVLSDVNMAGMDGFKLAEILRNSPEHEFIPIVFVTGDESEEFKQRSRKAGANGWIRKPFKPDQLIGLVQGFEI